MCKKHIWVTVDTNIAYKTYCCRRIGLRYKVMYYLHTNGGTWYVFWLWYLIIICSDHKTHNIGLGLSRIIFWIRFLNISNQNSPILSLGFDFATSVRQEKNMPFNDDQKQCKSTETFSTKSLFILFTCFSSKRNQIHDLYVVQNLPWDLQRCSLQPGCQ